MWQGQFFLWRSSEAHITWFHSDRDEDGSHQECWVAAVISDVLTPGPRHNGHAGTAASAGSTCKASKSIVLGTLVVDKSKQTFELVNYDATLETRCFMLGYSGEDKGQHTRGKFGDGLPSSTVKLAANKVSIRIFTAGQMYDKFCFKKDPAFGHECLHMHISNSGLSWRSDACLASQFSADTMSGSLRYGKGQAFDSHGFPAADPNRDTIVQLRGIGSGNFKPERYIFLHPKFRQDQTTYVTDGFADVFLDETDTESTRAHIFVRDMLAMTSTGANAPLFGYNLKQYSVKSRDRQDSIPQDDLGKQLAFAWSKVLTTGTANTEACKVARRAIYNAISTHPECAETNAICDGWGSPMDHVCSALVEQFRLEHGSDAFPLIRSDSDTRKIITDKLKKTPVEVNDKLFGCLSASDTSGFQCSAQHEWHKIRLKAMKSRTPAVQILEPFDTIFKIIRKSFTDTILEHGFPKIQLVDTSILEEVAVLDCLSTAKFELAGFDMAGREDLNGVYSECVSKGSVNGRPIFEHAKSDNHIVWTTSGWLLTNQSLNTVRRSTCPKASATCPEPMWWTKQVSIWRTWSHRDQVWASAVVKNSTRETSHAERIRQMVLYLNRSVLKQQLHTAATKDTNDRCRNPSNCICAFTTVFEAVLADLRDIAKIQMTDVQVQAARQLLMYELLALDRRAFQNSVDRLHGVDQKSKATRNLTRWLQSGLEEDGDDGSPEPSCEAERHARDLIKEQVELGVLRVNPDHSSSLAWVGDTILDAFLGLAGVDAGLRPRVLDKLRQRLFCSRRMGCDARGGKRQVREASEQREKVVGDLAMKVKSKLVQLLQRILDQAMLPSEKPPHREVAFSAEIKRCIEAAMTGPCEWENRQLEKQAGREACWYFVHGRCTAGPACYRAHPCKFFRRGRCTKGDACRFYHGKVSSSHCSCSECDANPI